MKMLLSVALIAVTAFVNGVPRSKYCSKSHAGELALRICAFLNPSSALFSKTQRSSC